MEPSAPSTGPVTERACRWLVWAAAAAGMGIGLLNAAVWLGPARAVASWPGMMVMRMNTATGIFAAGLSLLLWQAAAASSTLRGPAMGAGMFVALLGGLTAAQDLLGWDLGIDQLLAAGTLPGDLAHGLVRHAGRMSLNASISLFFLGLALAGLDGALPLGKGRRLHTAPVFALLAALPAASGLVGYLVGAQDFKGLLKSTAILLHTAVALFLLSLGTLAARPHRSPVSRLISPDADGILLRWLMPGSVALLLLQGWLITVGRGRGLVVPGEGTALMLYGSLVLLSALILLASKAVGDQQAHARRSELAYRDELVRAKNEAEQANLAKDHFLAALSHELRTPLTPVLLSATALRHDESLPAAVRSELAMIERNVALEARLIDDLLDLTRISRGKLNLQKEFCDAHSILGNAVEIVRGEALRKDLRIQLDLQASLCGLQGDPARLQQVFWNLFKNAVKFTPAGGSIAIRSRDCPQTGSLQIAVADTGVGFAPETAEQLFLAFEQGGLETAQRFGGLGLGLSIARAIVDLHGGTIRAESPGAGRGATFHLELPGATQPPAGLDLSPGRTALRKAPTTPRRILLVDDHEATLSILARLLRKAGHEVVTAASVAAALQAAAPPECFDVLVTDIGLPDGSGHDLMTRLHTRNPQWQGIALSGFGLDKDLALSRQTGFLLHLVKPVDFSQLAEAIEGLPAPAATWAARKNKSLH